jgi:hypothetical protein
VVVGARQHGYRCPIRGATHDRLVSNRRGGARPLADRSRLILVRRSPRGRHVREFTLSAVFAGSPLAPGSCRLAVIALDADGNRVGPVTAAFRVTR